MWFYGTIDLSLRQGANKDEKGRMNMKLTTNQLTRIKHLEEAPYVTSYTPLHKEIDIQLVSLGIAKFYGGNFIVRLTDAFLDGKIAIN